MAQVMDMNVWEVVLGEKLLELQNDILHDWRKGI